ncbi:2-keto-4-pentenoate hydratase [Lysobacter gummosus]|uniref:2-keto-4-pentenoate hydratase n=1 Tax=Lysobacter gummosus TaxID=262324 RepID=UPI00363A0005
MDKHPFDDSFDPAAVAARLVLARRTAEALPVYPGPLPRSLDEGYRAQDRAIAQWGSEVAGWKVGRIPESWEQRLGEDRLVGPIFAEAVQHVADGQAGRFAVIERGFAAVEAEFVFELGHDAPPGQLDFNHAQAAALVSALSIGIELAGSPMPMINALGPPVVVSDFGNNAGLIVGPRIAAWQSLADHELTCETFIDERSVGRGGAASIPGGLLAALAFALTRCARRGHPLKAGMYVTTGAATGIHDILAGQRSRISFGRWGSLHCETVPARGIAGAIA